VIDKEDLKNSLTPEDITNIVCHLGSDPPRTDNKGNLVFQTMCHNHTGGSYKLYYYDNSKLFSCYTECDGTFDIYGLVQKVKSITFTEAILFVQQFTGYSVITNNLPKEDRISDWDFIKKYQRNSFSVEALKKYDPRVLEIYAKKYHISWIEEGISKKAMDKFNIRFDLSNNRIIIPHYDIDKNLIGIRCRNLNQDLLDRGMKYVPIKVENTVYSHPLSYNLYGIGENLENIKTLKKIIVFEGEKSVLKMESFYPEYNCAVAVCGDKISDYQKRMIAYYADEVIIAFDKSENYKPGNRNEGINRVRDIAKKLATYTKTSIVVDKKNLLSLKDAPIDQGKGVFEQLMKSRVEVKTHLNL